MHSVDLHHVRERDEDRIGLQLRITMKPLGAVSAVTLFYGITQF